MHMNFRARIWPDGLLHAAAKTIEGNTYLFMVADFTVSNQTPIDEAVNIIIGALSCIATVHPNLPKGVRYWLDLPDMP